MSTIFIALILLALFGLFVVGMISLVRFICLGIFNFVTSRLYRFINKRYYAGRWFPKLMSENRDERIAEYERTSKQLDLYRTEMEKRSSGVFRKAS